MTKATSPAPAAVQVSQAAARRFLLYHQGLLKVPGRPWPAAASRVSRAAANAGPRAGAGPNSALAAIQRLEAVQIDPVNTVAPNHHLVLASRVRGYRPAHLESLLAERRVFEHFLQARCVIPVGDFAFFRPRFDDAALVLASHWEMVRETGAEVLERIRREGPLDTRAFENSPKVSGYWDPADVARTKASNLALEVLWETGQLMLSGREGNRRTYDLTERVIPQPLLDQFASLSEEEARAAIRQKYYKAFRIFDLGDFRFGWRRQPAADRRQAVQRDVEAGILAPVSVENVRRPYYVLCENLPLLAEAENWEPGSGGAFLSPLDNLLWRRERLTDLFAFEYTWEQYTPVAKRKYGAYAMPLLVGDRLVGRMDPRLDRNEGVLVVNRLDLEPGVRPTRTLARALNGAAANLLAFLGASSVRYESVQPSRLRDLLD